MKNIELFLFLAFLSGSAACLAADSDEDLNCNSDISPVAHGSCLEKQLKGLEEALAKKRVEVAAASGRQHRRRHEREIGSRATDDDHAAWQVLVDIECRDLAGSVHWGGTTTTAVEWKCRMDRTREKIQRLVKK